MKNAYIKWILSIIMGAISTFAEKYQAIICFVMIAIVFDTITGIVAAKANEEKITSKKGYMGFWKKVSLICALGFGFLLDYFIPYCASNLNLSIKPTALFGMIFGCYIVINECISILENINKANPNILPSWVSRLLINVKDQIDKKGESENE